ncbi:MAG: hypothetical protein QXH20_07105 [Candidatus Bathyarchaeia archaeon]
MSLIKTLEKNKRWIAIILVFLLLYFGYVKMSELGTLQPGFEGAKCYFYGVDFRWGSEWSGAYKLHRYQDAEPVLLEYRTGTWEKTIKWGTVATPNDAVITWREVKKGLGMQWVFCKPDLGIHVESNIPLKDVTRQGDPLNWNSTDPTSGRRIEYWSKKVVKEETADKVLYHYTVEKESFLIVPAEFWVGFYLVPSQQDAGTGSGWREGEWQNIVVWFRLDWNVWDNAYRDPWLDDPKINVFDSLYNGTILNQKRLYEYRGGFPIAAWIQGWEKAGWTSGGRDDTSPLWYDVKGKKTGTYTDKQLAQLREKLMAKVQFAPGLVGQFLSLYNEPSASFTYEAKLHESKDYPIDITNYVKSPDSRMKKIMYFPINILNFGTYVEGDWWNGWTVYYPSAYFRVRILYGVYGKFTYLWTEELAKSPTVNYPEQPERHGTTVITVQGASSWFSGIANWFANPLTQLWMFFILIVIVIIVVSIFSPGIWTALALRRRKE